MDELYVICRTVEIDDRDVKGFVLMREGENGEPKPWPIMITRKCNQFYGYENACPHQGSRLDTTPGQFLDEDENFITCGNHQAQFDPDTGECFIGPCKGQAPDADHLGDRRRRCLFDWRRVGGRGRRLSSPTRSTPMQSGDYS